jgi:hypothetical protein
MYDMPIFVEDTTSLIMPCVTSFFSWYTVQARHKKYHPRDGGTDLASDASDPYNGLQHIDMTVYFTIKLYV